MIRDSVHIECFDTRFPGDDIAETLWFLTSSKPLVIVNVCLLTAVHHIVQHRSTHIVVLYPLEFHPVAAEDPPRDK